MYPPAGQLSPARFTRGALLVERPVTLVGSLIVPPAAADPLTEVPFPKSTIFPLLPTSPLRRAVARL